MKDSRLLKAILEKALYFFWVAFVFAWFFVPFVVDAGKINSVPAPFRFFSVLLGASVPLPLSILGLIAAWIVLPLSAWKVVAVFLDAKLPAFLKYKSTLSLALEIFTSALTLVVPAVHISIFATSAAYFGGYPWWSWIFIIISIVWNVLSVTSLISDFSARDVIYQQYISFKKGVETGKLTFLGFAKNWGIQRRLTLAFTGLIFFIIVILATVLLRDFSKTLLGAAKENAHAIAERTASVIKANAGDQIAIRDYFLVVDKKNDIAAFRFADLSWYRRDAKKDAFIVQVSTDEKLLGKVKPNDNAVPDKFGQILVETAGFMEFRSSVVLGGVTLGYAAVRYERDVIYGPYYRARAKAIMISALFIYLSIFITYLFGRGIVYPILFLRMSVSQIASKLASMVNGTEKISAELLRYDDRVDTKDEIKKLSLEVGNMTSVIRGVIPYISASTLKYSERETPTTESRDLAFLFTDIRGFTTLCEGRSPESVVKLLNHYLELQTTVIVANGGDVDKFVGDEVMAMFDGPEKELNACRAGLAIRKAMAEEQERARKESQAVIAIGIGINSGPVVFGSVGARNRMDFTSIGDTVNLAARLEGATKTYGTKSLITDTVYEKVKDVFLCREIDLLTVKGKTKPVRIYEFLQEKAHAADKLLLLKTQFEAGLTAYRKQSWVAARKYFTELVKMSHDETSAVFLQRIELFQINPPPKDWDGVFNLTVK